ncbi:MAG: EamA family transporter [Candidatus Berkelbacteria bacterium]|nr:EamA family transporter [Candidatus Berkelbacteria bacterium]
MRTYLILFIAIIVGATGSVFWKKAFAQTGGITLTSTHVFGDIWKLLGTGYFWAGIGTAIIAVLCLFDILSHEDLSYAAPLFSLSYVLALLVSKIFLHEQVSLWRWLGVIIILLGVFLITKTR